MSVYDEVI